jgi:hypothetical protein
LEAYISGAFDFYALRFGMDIGVDLKKHKMFVANLLKIISSRLANFFEFSF